MTVHCPFSFCEKTSFLCFSNTFRLHLKFHLVKRKEIILSMQLHLATFRPSHYISLAASDVPSSFPTLTSALTSEDKSHQASKICSASLVKHHSTYWYFPFPHIQPFRRMSCRLCHSDQKSYWFAFCGPLFMWCTAPSLDTSHWSNKILCSVSRCTTDLNVLFYNYAVILHEAQEINKHPTCFL